MLKINDGIGDKEDKQPQKYNISDYTLSLVAGISYKDSIEDICSSIGSNEFKHLKEFNLSSSFFSKNSHFWDIYFDAGFSGVALYYKGVSLMVFRGTNNYIDWLYANPELVSGIIKTKQIDCANDFYNRNFNKKTYLCGHSLGGRLVQEIVYRCNDFNAPLHATTFNALGYNKIQKSVNSVYEHIIRKNNITKIITNYYIKFDFVGEGLGHSLTFERYGEDKPAIYIKDIDDVQDSLHLTNKKTRYLGKIKIGLDYSKQELHGINLFYDTIKYGDIYDY